MQCNFVLPTLWQQLGKAFFVPEWDNVTVYKVHKEWFAESSVDETDWLAQSQDLNPTETHTVCQFS